MRLTYLDDAGVFNAQQEPFIVVGGFMVEADKQLVALENHLDILMRKHIPEKDWRTFIFHATELWSGTRYFKDKALWPHSKRLEILDDLAAVPEKFDLLLSCGFVDRVAAPQHLFKGGVTEEMREAILLGTALARFSETVEGFMRECTEDEIAMLIAEDRDSLRFAIKQMHELLRDETYLKSNGITLKNFPFERIRDTIHFAKKAESKPLQIADLCTFFVKGYLTRKRSAERFWDVLVRRMIVIPKEDSRTPVGAGQPTQ